MSTITSDLGDRLTMPSSRGDRIFRTVTAGSGVVVLVILAGIAISTTVEAWPAFAKSGLAFGTTNDWNPAEGRYGALAFIYGTFVV